MKYLPGIVVGMICLFASFQLLAQVRAVSPSSNAGVSDAEVKVEMRVRRSSHPVAGPRCTSSCQKGKHAHHHHKHHGKKHKKDCCASNACDRRRQG